MKRAFVIFCLILLSNIVYSQENFLQYAEKLEHGIDTHFFIKDSSFYRENEMGISSERPVSFLWSLCALFQAEFEYKSIFPKDNNYSKVLSVIDKYLDNRAPVPAFASYSPLLQRDDRYYDDNQWIGITALDDYLVSKKERFLSIGTTVYNFMMSGFDTISGGGIYWVEQKKEGKNTCSNGPGVLVALKMYSATKNSKYLDTAKLLYNWTKDKLQDVDYLYWDNLNIKSGKIDKTKFSYNSGTMLESAAYLYQLTKNKKYLNDANNIANAAGKYFLVNGTLKDDYWFSAVLLRGYIRLYTINKDTTYLNAFTAAVNKSILMDWNTKTNLMGLDKKHNLVWQGGMLEMLSSLGKFQKNKIIE